jgi:VWFA-related protein
MLSAAKKIPFIIISLFLLAVPTLAQGLIRELPVSEGATIEVVNRFGRISARAQAPTNDPVLPGKLTATGGGSVLEKDIKINKSSGHIVVLVDPSDQKKRIDLVLILLERTNLKLQTGAGAIEVGGDFASIEATTDTGTIAVDVPDEDLKYSLLWTESRPRVLADFDLEKIKEKSGGKYEIKGRHQSEEFKAKRDLAKNESSTGDKDENKKDGNKVQEPETAGSDPPSVEGTGNDTSNGKDGNTEDPKKAPSVTVSLNLTTARGILLLNVPPTEVLSDLRERPLTEAAKAIVRSGDSLLTEAIRRASPRYFGDYTRTLPPLKKEPSFVVRSDLPLAASAAQKTALVRVTDLNNRAISGLSAKDFEVLENGTSRPIVSVERSTAPFNLVLLLDVSGSVENYVNFIRKAARSFVTTVDANDRVSIIIFNEDVKVLSKFTTDKEKLYRSLDTFDAGGGTAYYDALAYTIADTLRPLKGERTAVVILTDGDDNRSFLPFDALIGSIQESGALIYPLYVPSGLIAAAAEKPGADIDPMRKKYMSLTAKSVGEGERLAKISGGVYYPISQIGQIQRAYEDIVIQMRSAYNVTFTSDPNLPTGVSPRLKIKTKRENAFATISSVEPSAGKE